MTHLSAAEFTDALDGRLAPGRSAHVDSCAGCAARLASLVSAADEIHAADDVPDPSPLFWKHFGARVSASVRDVSPEPHVWWRHPAWAIACSLVIVVAVVVGVRDTRARWSRGMVAPAAGPTAEQTSSDDDAWVLLTAVAASVQQDDPQAPPVTVRPSEIDHAVVNLSGPEREELRKLLQDEMKRPGD